MESELKLATPCSIANLMGAIFGRDPDLVKQKLGLPLQTLPAPVCLNCGGEIKGAPNWLRKAQFCCWKCRLEYSDILVICDGCGITFYRRRSQLTQAIGKANYQRVYHSRECWVATGNHLSKRGRKEKATGERGLNEDYY